MKVTSNSQMAVYSLAYTPKQPRRPSNEGEASLDTISLSPESKKMHPLLAASKRLANSADLVGAAKVNGEGQLIGYSKLNSPEQVNEFMAVFESVSMEHQDKLRYLPVDESFLDLTDKLTTQQIETVIDSAFSLHKDQVLNQNYMPEQIIDYIHGLAALSDDKLNTTLGLTKQLLDIGEQELLERSVSKRYPPGTMWGTTENKRLYKPDYEHPTEGFVTDDQVGAQMVKRLTEAAQQLTTDELTMLGQNIEGRSYLATRGILDMAALSSRHDKGAFFNLLSEPSEQTDALFELFGAQSDKLEFTSFYHASKNQDSEDKHLVKLYYAYNTDSDEQRQSMMADILALHKTHGADFLNEAAQLLRDVDASDRADVWQQWIEVNDDTRKTTIDNLAEQIDANKDNSAVKQQQLRDEIRESFKWHFESGFDSELREIELSRKSGSEHV
ncbi:hypothetical protein [Pseudoalteromonas obscura]|uniref:Uncharacterized protein n=1 Tax=Pseudoalteromonas obscura TaxID=3048491 RepID=A0ABT7EKK5_9GAMM|nr:hypothetical protein [Pseudoalteromonas sp. P94(2023)]MDK2595559.1 hypothetical protein [Pseudoalteromonas sp. P94(2023)]